MSELLPTPAELAAELAVCERAVAGPWKSRPSPVDPKPYRCVYFGPNPDEAYNTSSLQSQEARFIAMAREALPLRLRQLQAALEEIDRLRAALKQSIDGSIEHTATIRRLESELAEVRKTWAIEFLNDQLTRWPANTSINQRTWHYVIGILKQRLAIGSLQAPDPEAT